MAIDLEPIRNVCTQLEEVGDSHRRDLLVTRLHRLMAPAYGERASLEHRLGVGMDWLAANEGHPEHAAREELWMMWERSYRDISDLLETARLATLAPGGISQPGLHPT